MLTRKVGKGTITYVGAWLDPALLAKLTSNLLNQAGVQPMIPSTPKGVEVCMRTGAKGSVLILINHNKAAATVTLPQAMNDLLAGGSHSSVELPMYGVAVLGTTSK